MRAAREPAAARTADSVVSPSFAVPPRRAQSVLLELCGVPTVSALDVENVAATHRRRKFPRAPAQASIQ